MSKAHSDVYEVIIKICDSGSDLGDFLELAVKHLTSRLE